MYELNQIVTLKKAHPCGGKEWRIVRFGVDVKLQCQTCGKYVNLTHDEMKKRVKAIKDKNEEKNA